MSAVLVTRAQPEAEATAARVRALGFEAIVAPALEIEFLPFDVDAKGVQALLVSSAAAARSAGAHAALQSLPLWVTGQATAAAARAAGFSHVRSADGAGAALIALAKAALKPAGGVIFHLRGQEVAVDIAAALRGDGFDARDLIVYRAREAVSLPTETLTALTAAPSRIESVLFHSARGASAFARLARAPGLVHVSGDLAALCLSERVAQAAKALAWREIRVAPAPREDALLTLLGRPEGERT